MDYILETRKRGRALEYLVRWKGFGETEDSWEPARGLKGAKKAIDAFKAGAVSIIAVIGGSK